MDKSDLNVVTGHIVDAAYKLHQTLGPGLLESVYEAILARDLERREMAVARQIPLSFTYDGMFFHEALRIDLMIEGKIIVEIKSVEKLVHVHSKQLLTYLRLLNLPVGLLINFGAPTLKEGLRRVANGWTAPRLPELE